MISAHHCLIPAEVFRTGGSLAQESAVPWIQAAKPNCTLPETGCQTPLGRYGDAQARVDSSPRAYPSHRL